MDMIVVTGGAGFIGSCIVAELNAMGIDHIIIVDHVEPGSLKKKNLTNKRYRKYYEKGEFLELALANRLPKEIDHVIHMGACSSTALTDADYYQKNNFEYSCHLARWALKHNARFIYASSAATYGDGRLGYSDEDHVTRTLKPLNLYGDSKHWFDLWVMDNGLIDRVVGLKFFNVFGPNEYHKGDMRSVAAKAYRRVVDEGVISLFKSYKSDFADGEQKRDFVYVKDAVDVVMFFFEHDHLAGIYNVGTGEAKSWNDLASALFAAAGKPLKVEYVDMPENLRPGYQYFTQADMTKLRRQGYSKPFIPLAEAVRDYVSYLQDGRNY